MMKKLLYHSSVLLALAAIALASCEKEDSTGIPPEGTVLVQPVIAGCYDGLTSVKTRGWNQDNTQLTPDKIHQLDDGSTLWLIVYQKNTATGIYEELPSYRTSYVVKKVTDNYSALYPCTVDADGNYTAVGARPLYLSGGIYRFRALSPARGLTEDGKISVKNGQYLLATDDRYIQTSATKEVEIQETSEAEVRVVELNPIINQTARMKFSIKQGDGVHNLEMLSSGIEISGIQNEKINDNVYNWALGDTLKIYLGDKNSWTTIQECKQESSGTLVAETGILPTDARSNSIIVLLNLKVNGVPTQYQMMLNDMLLQAGYSYNYVVTVTIRDGVTVITWQNRSWTEDVVMN